MFAPRFGLCSIGIDAVASFSRLTVLLASRLMRKFLPLLYAAESRSRPGDRASRLGWDRAREAFVGD